MEKNNGILDVPLQSKKSIVSKIVDQITEAIIQGELKPGERLPTEVELCNALQVGRNSVREAIKILESYGVVHIKRADGTYVSNTYTQQMLDPMLYGILLQKDSASDIIELRKVLDIGMLMVASQKLHKDNMADVIKYLEELEVQVYKEEIDIDVLLKADVDFHMSIVKAIDNALLISMYHYVDRITIPSRKQATQCIIQKDVKDSFINLHKDIVDLILRQDVDQISEVVNRHYRFWKQIQH